MGTLATKYNNKVCFFYAKLTIKKRYSQSHSQGLVQGDLENKMKSNWENAQQMITDNQTNIGMEDLFS